MNMNHHLDKNHIIPLISRIRRDIGHKDVEPDIREVVWDENSRELVIITSDRPGKSIVIGKGGWVAGRLKEELGIKSVHVEAYTDLMVRRYRMELARNRLDQIRANYNSQALHNLAHLLEGRIEKPHALETLLEKYEVKPENTPPSVVALSGGVDSSFSLILAKILGFHPRAVTVNPGSIILPGYFKRSVEHLTRKLRVPHKYLPLDLEEVIQESLEGRFHPCGRCSKLIEETVLSHAQKLGAQFLFYGDLLSTGADSLILEGDILRINLPAMLSATKSEVKGIAGSWGVKKKAGYGCPLLKEVQKKNPSMRRYSIQRIERETRAGVLEPGEALDMIMRLI
jgi:hypothetical protein